MMTGRAFALRALAAALALFPLALSAHADPAGDDKAKAREEFRRGLQLEAAKDFEGALTVFKGVALVKSSPAVRFHIAVCEEKTGDWIGALGAYRIALADAKDAKVAQVQDESEKAIATLEPKIPKLTIVRGDGAASATIVLDGHELGPASVGVPMSVNPGPHHIEASAPEHDPSTNDVTAEEGKPVEVDITLKVTPVAPSNAGQGEGAGSAPITEEHHGPSALVPMGGTIVALGAASFVVSGVFFGLRQKAISKLDAACGADRQSCPASLASTRDSGRLDATVSMGTFIGGAAGVGLGGILLIVEVATKPKKKKPASAAALDFDVQPTPSGLGVGGTF